MNHDSPDGNYTEPKYIECPECKGTGQIPECDDQQIDINFIPCLPCWGTGQIEIIEEEHQEQGKDNEADLNE